MKFGSKPHTVKLDVLYSFVYQINSAQPLRMSYRYAEIQTNEWNSAQTIYSCLATTYRPPTNRPPTDHLLTTYRPPTDHLPTIYQPSTDHLPTNFLWCSLFTITHCSWINRQTNKGRSRWIGKQTDRYKNTYSTHVKQHNRFLSHKKRTDW